MREFKDYGENQACMGLQASALDIDTNHYSRMNLKQNQSQLMPQHPKLLKSVGGKMLDSSKIDL
jgi:hypothetical protein